MSTEKGERQNNSKNTFRHSSQKDSKKTAALQIRVNSAWIVNARPALYSDYKLQP